MKMTGLTEKQRIQANQHFFAASTSQWIATTPDRPLPQVLRMMERDGQGYNLFLVPLPHDATYDISFYQPQVEGTQWLGYFEGEKK
jgi:hypothetical protein